MKADIIPDTTDPIITRERFHEIVGLYSRYVYTITCRILGDRSSAEEASQETFIKAFRCLDSFDRTLGLKNWLCTIAINTARDYYRKSCRYRGTTTSHPDIDRLIDPTDTVSVADNRLDVEKILGLLEIKYRTVVVLFYMERLEIKEIAALLKKPPSVIKVRLFRARKMIAKRYGALFS